MEGLSGKIVYSKVDVDQDSELSAKYNVRNIPTLILLNEFGDEVGRKVGVQSKESILNFYNG
jgi:thioredoxin 1